ncbi:PepSY domain-containing protein [Methylotenera versatilis]|uniref:PepSY domain-containing protein n=1 Tax=Methylotenera versatilis TaxID=1055487 RepID=UPI000AFBC087|nr:PepSY domain-containing protein [Methylotenera versatilis]
MNSLSAEEDYQLAKKLRQQGEILPLEKILAFARAKKNGEVLETEFEKKGGRYIYEVEILDIQGQVWELKLDAKTGQLIKIEIDD